MRNAPAAVLALPDFGKPLIGFQRITSGCNEIDGGVEIGTTERGVKRCGADLRVKFFGNEWLSNSAPQDVLGQHIERTRAQWRRILCILGHGIDGRAALKHLEAICRY